MPRRHRSRLVFSRRQQTQAHRRAVVDEGGVGADRVAGDAGVDMTGDLIEVPGGDARALAEPAGGPQAGAGEGVAGGGDLGRATGPLARLLLGEGAGHGVASLVGELQLQRAQVLARGDGPAAVVDDAEGHAQVAGDAVELDVGGRDGRVRQPLDDRGDGGGERLVGRLIRQLCRDLHRPVVRRDDLSTDGLRERLDDGGDELGAEARHLPVEAVRAHPGEQGQRDDGRDAVVDGARLEAVPQREALVVLPPARRVGRLVDLGRVLRGESLRRHREQVGGVGARAPPPSLEAPRRIHVGGYALLVELEDGLVVEQDVAAPRAFLELLELGAELAVGAVEGLLGVPLALHERVPDEELAGVGLVDAGELHPAPRDDRNAVQRHLLVGDDSALRLLPVRFAVAALQQVSGERLRPRRVDGGVHAAEEAAGLDELGAHDGIRLLLGER